MSEEEKKEEKENSTIAHMRAQIQKANEEKAAAEAAKKVAEEALEVKKREELAENERLKLEIEDLRKKAETGESAGVELAQYQKKLEELYTTRLATVPEEHKKNVEILSKEGNWTVRLEKLDAAIAMIPKPQKVGGAGSAAIVTDPVNEAAIKVPTTEDGKIDPKQLTGSITQGMKPVNVAAARQKLIEQGQVEEVPSKAAAAAAANAKVNTE